jgi:hypothetical protein
MASSNLPAYLLWGVGGAALILGGAFGIAAISAKSSFDDNPTYGRADSVHTRAIVADVGLGLGLILAATGTVFYFGRPAESAPQAASGTAPATKKTTLAQVSAAPIVGPSTGGCAVNVRF